MGTKVFGLVNYHAPVLVEAVTKHLITSKKGVYVDGTLGGGGHSRALLQALDPTAKLIALDWDPDSEKNLRVNGEDLLADRRFTFVAAPYSELEEVLSQLGIHSVDGILLDLGVSSHQLDTAERGFSFRYEAPLDMRMNAQGLTAYQLIQEHDEKTLAEILRMYGEVPQARRLARNIKTFLPFTTHQLVEVIQKTYGYRARYYMAQVFQALRIWTNDELTHLQKGLQAAHKLLRKGGRLAILTYHSLEDQCVKNFFSYRVTTDPVRGQSHSLWTYVIKSLTPSPQEIYQNPRSRSAKLRIAQKL